MTVGIDVSSLFAEVIMLSSTTDIIQKKLVYLYLSNYAGICCKYAFNKGFKRVQGLGFRVDCLLLFVVYCLLHIVYYLLLIASCLLFVACCLLFKVQGIGYRVQGLGFRVQGLGFVRAETNPSLAILAVNAFQKDCADADPRLRGLAIRSLCSLR